MAGRGDRSRSRDGTFQTYHLVCYSDFCIVEMAVASRMHGMWGRAAAAGDDNVLAMRRCEMTGPASSQSQHPWDPTCGAWELAGMALSLQLAGIELSGIPQARTHPERVDVTFYSPNENIVDLVTHRDALGVVPRHLQRLVCYVRAKVDALRVQGFRVKPAWARRTERLQMRRVGAFACESQWLHGHGWVWPIGLQALLERSNQIQAEAPSEIAEINRLEW